MSAKLQRDLWAIDSFRPGMIMWDSTRNKHFRELQEAYENDTIDDHRKALKMAKKQYAANSLDHNEKEMEEMRIAVADETGRVVTDDPILAFHIYHNLMSGMEINHPLTKRGVKCEVDKLSPPIPTAAQVEKLLKEKEVPKKTS